MTRSRQFKTMKKSLTIPKNKIESLKFKTELVLTELKLSSAKIKNISQENPFALKRGIIGPAILKFGGKVIAMGELIVDGKEIIFSLTDK